MIPKRAIEKAIEGGWKESMEIDKVVMRGTLRPGNPDFNEEADVELWHADQRWLIKMEEIALDPSFWQALSKALDITSLRMQGMPWWQFSAHDFYDLILTGGDVQKFWDELII